MSAASVLVRWPLIGRRGELDRVATAMSDPAAGGVVIYGQAGVGKTRLADEALALAERSGHVVARAVGGQTARGVPLGPFVHLLPRDLGLPAEAEIERVEQLHLLNLARAQVMALAGDGQSLVLGIDDAHLLDPTSAALVGLLATTRAAFVVATVRSGEAVPDAIAGLWRNGTALRVDLDGLSFGSVDTLLHRALGGPLDGAALAELWEISRGNALFLRELVHGALDSGALVEQDGAWRLAAPLKHTAQLIELVEERLAHVDEDGRRALELLALGQPLGLTDLEQEVPIDALERLERSGLIRVETHQARTLVYSAHPLHAHVVRGALPVLTARARLRTLIAMVERRGARRRDDLLRVTTWRINANEPADPDVLLRSARIARALRDTDTALRLATLAYHGAATAEAAFVLGSLLAEQGRVDEAEDMLAGGMAQPDAGAHLVGLAVARSTNLFWGRVDDAAALAVCDEAERRVATGEEREELLVHRAGLAHVLGRPAEAIEALSGIGPDAEPARLAAAALTRCQAFAVMGRTSEALRAADDADRARAALPEPVTSGPLVLADVHRGFALVDAGRLADAERLMQRGFDIAVGDRAPGAQLWFAMVMARVGLFQGRPVTAERWCRQAGAAATASGVRSAARLAIAGRARAAGYRGDAGTASAAVAELAGASGGLHRVLDVEVDLGRAWERLAAGDVAGAVAGLRDAAARAASSGRFALEAAARYDLVRLGEAKAEAARLGELAERCDGAMFALYAAHAAGAAAGDADALEAAAGGFEGTGANLYAAEALGGAVEAARAAGDARRATLLTRRALDLLARCEGACTPLVPRAEPRAALTKREHEVALLAADGLSSRVIGEKLFLSVRTVENHVQNVYAKLGVSTRAELAAAMRAPGQEEQR